MNNNLRDILFQTIHDVRDGKIDVEKAKMVNELGKTINDQAHLHIKAAETFRGVSSDGLFDFEPPKKALDK